MIHSEKTQGFTLIEIVVVIAVLSLLTVISFVTYTSYNQNARDGQRVQDLSSISKSLDLYLNEKDTLPPPSNGAGITFTGMTVWTQGTFGDSVLDEVKNPKKLPVDPKYGIEYTYSLLNDKVQYQVATILEDQTSVAMRGKSDGLFAEGIAQAASTRNPAVSSVLGNYNNLVAKVEKSGVIYVLAIPSIITTDLKNATIEAMIMSGNVLVTDKSRNLPYAYASLGLDMTGSFDSSTPFTRGLGSVLIWTGTSLPKDASSAFEFISNLKNAYSGTLTAQGDSLSPILAMTSNTDLVSKSNDIITKYLDGGQAGGSLAVMQSISGNFKAISTGNNFSCAVDSLGGVKCWGVNWNGNLGNGGTGQSLSPTQVTGLTSGVVDITSGGNHTCVLTKAGGVKCWGLAVYGQLGDGGTGGAIGASLVPVDVPGLTSGVASVVAGQNHTCAVMTGGALKCWGYNNYGQTGNGDTQNVLSPIDVPGFSTGVLSIAPGYSHTCVVMTSGGMKCWGVE